MTKRRKQIAKEREWEMGTLPPFSCYGLRAIDTGRIAMTGYLNLGPVQNRAYELFFLFFDPIKHNY